MKFYTIFNTTIGNILLTANYQSLTGLYVVGQRYYPKIQSNWKYCDDLEIFLDTKSQLVEYLNGQRTKFKIQYHLEGTSLQLETWDKLSEIQYGETISYKDLAELTSSPKAIRAVATAVGCNPLLIILPCHRVVGSDGSLKGYAAGLDLKKMLLNLEKQYFDTIKVVDTIAIPDLYQEELKEKEDKSKSIKDTKLKSNWKSELKEEVSQIKFGMENDLPKEKIVQKLNYTKSYFDVIQEYLNDGHFDDTESVILGDLKSSNKMDIEYNDDFI